MRTENVYVTRVGCVHSFLREFAVARVGGLGLYENPLELFEDS